MLILKLLNLTTYIAYLMCPMKKEKSLATYTRRKRIVQQEFQHVIDEHVILVI